MACTIRRMVCSSTRLTINEDNKWAEKLICAYAYGIKSRPLAKSLLLGGNK